MRTPMFWATDGAISQALSPLSIAYGLLASRRRDLDPYQCPVPVVCVGNVTAGGSGKTPLAQALMRSALTLGISAHFLTRGYGGNLRGPVQVDPARHTFTQAGDEPLLLAAQAPTWVSRDRVAGAKAAAAAGAQLIIMDDGYQNPHIVKDVSVLVIDGGFGFGNGRLLPAGPLREPVQAAVERADAAIVINSTIMVSSELIAGMAVKETGMATIASAPHQLKGKPVIAFAGIGRPAKFRETLQSEGVQIAEFHPFGDHHAYTPRELDRLLAASRTRDARLVTTEKDFIRLPSDFRAHVTILPITLEFDDPTLLERLIRKAMAR